MKLPTLFTFPFTSPCSSAFAGGGRPFHPAFNFNPDNSVFNPTHRRRFTAQGTGGIVFQKSYFGERVGERAGIHPVSACSSAFGAKGEGEWGREKTAVFFHNATEWVKQHLRIKEFYETSENAVEIRICCAIIAYCWVAIVEHDLQSEMDTNI